MSALAFSTLGCPGLPLGQVAEMAARHGFSGVELRAAGGEPVHLGLDAAARRNAVTALSGAGVRALSVASYVRVADPGADDDAVIAAGIVHGLLAADLAAPYLRVFPGGRIPAGPDTDDPDHTYDAHDAHDADETDEAAIRRIRAIARGLSGSGVTVALETHDSHPRGADTARILDRCPGSVAIWDVLHTWRAGESAADTLAALAGRLAYVQVKDVASVTDLLPVAPGDGVLPLGEVADALRGAGYRGWVSWEYERAWFPQQPDLASLAGRVAGWMRVAFDRA